MSEPEPAADGEATSFDLTGALNQLAGLVLSRETVETALELVTSVATTATADTMGAGVTVVDEQGKRSRAASNPWVERADALQYELDEGPCLTAWRSGELVRIDDTTTDGRFPRWNEWAARLGVRSVLSAPLVAAGESIGAMKVYGERPSTYGERDERVMEQLARQAAILLANAQSLREARRHTRQLTEALASRDAIAHATGILLARGTASPRDAFGALAATARRADRTVEEVARALVDQVTARDADSPGP
jgi:GAF domain-containing protein